MKRLFKWLLLLIIALAVGVVFILYNPHVIKGPLERYLSDAAGYTIRLDGDMEIKTGRLIQVTARNIYVSGPDWASQEALVAAGHLNLVLNTASVFKDIIIVESLQVDDMQINLETDDEGNGNWITANKPPTPPEKKSDGPLVIFNDIQVRDTALRFRNGKTDFENILNVASLSHQQHADGMLHTTLNGDLNNRLVEYTHSVGPYNNLIEGRDINYKATGHFGELALEGDAYIDSLRAPGSPRFTLDMQGPNIDEITAMLGIDDLGGGGFSLRAKGAQVDDQYEAEISGQVGDISLNAAAQTSDIKEFNNLDLDLAISGPSLGAVTRLFGIENWPDKPFNLEGRAERVGGTLDIRDLTLNIGGTKLLLDALLTEFPSLNSSRVKLSVSGDEIEQFHELLGIKGIAAGPFSLKGNLDVSSDFVESLQVEFESSMLSAGLSGTLGEAPSYAGSKLDLQLNGKNANSVMSAFGIDVLPGKPFNLNTRVELEENGLLFEGGEILTVGDERLELGGFVAYRSGGVGTNVILKLSGEHLAEMLGQYAENIQLPESSYELSGQVQVLEDGIRLDDLLFAYESISLDTRGLIKLDDQLSGTTLNFKLNGKNLSGLMKFPAVGDSLDIFVPGQSYQATGNLEFHKDGLALDAVKARIGKTDIGFDALLSKQPDRFGSRIQFSIKGPDLNELLIKKGEPGLPEGAFETSAKVMLASEVLSIKEFYFDTPNANGRIDLEVGWPFDTSNNINFKVNLRGDDIRNFLPQMESFEAEMAAFQIDAAGAKKGDLVKIDQFDSNVGNLQISLTAKTDESNADDKVEIAFDILSQDISKLGRLNGRALPDLPLSLKADLKGNAREFGLQNLVGSLGESRMDGELDISLTGSKPDIRLTAKSDYIDIRPFMGPGQKEPDEEPAPGKKPERLIPATPLPLDTLAANDSRIRLEIAELRYETDSITDLILDVEQKNGILNVSELSYKAPRGKLKASLSVNPVGSNSADVKIDLDTKGFVINFSGVPEEKLDQIPAFDIDFHASGTGSNLQELAGSLDGSFYIGSKGGNAENVDLSLLDTFILEQIFSTIMPKSKDSLDTRFSCIAGKLEINDGLVTTKPALAFSTRKIAVVTKGTLDLKTEKMNFNFNSTPTNALQINPGEMFYPYILITGTLAKPTVGVDPGKAVLHGGAAVATLGISVLAKGVLDRAGNAIPVCEEMLNNPPEQK